MSALNATELPNPFTPLAFLPPTLASQLEASRYLYVATLAVSKMSIRCEQLSHQFLGLHMGHGHGNARRIQNASLWEVRFAHCGVCGVSVSVLS